MDSEHLPPAAPNWTLTRRDFLHRTAALSVGVAAMSSAQEPSDTLRFGLVTDLHYADVDPLGTRHYRESIPKLEECIAEMYAQDVAFLCELGDLKDEDSKRREEERTLGYLRTVESAYAKFEGPRHYVLGNHDLDSISKQQFIDNTAMPAARYSFDVQGRHFVVLDANFTAEGEDYDHGNYGWMDTNIPQAQIDWLAKDLAETELPTIVFCHQRLDGEGAHFVNNAPAVRETLEKSGKVLAVFHGHDHRGDLNTINGIHYYTLIAVVEGSGAENSSYALVEAAPNGHITVTGYRRAKDAALNPA